MAQFSKLDKARAQIVMDHPFVASILLRHPIIARKDIPTLAVNQRGQIYYNPDFIEGLTVPQVVWGLSHEVFHRIGQHVQRQGKRKKGKWNYATDAWINDTLDEANIGTRIENTVNMPGSHKETCEDIYAKLPDNDGKGPKGKEKGKGPPGGDGGGEQGDDPMDGDGIGDDLLDEGQPLSEGEQRELEAQIKVEVAEAAQAAKMRGNLPAVLQQFASDIIDVKTPWFDILEPWMVQKASQDYNWSRPNKRYSALDIYMPKMQNEACMGPVVIQVDISGSVSQEEIKHYNGHMRRIVELCKPEKVHVLYTDTGVHKHEEFDRGEEMQINFYSGGGTDMRAGYQYIKDHGIEADVFITLTDGYTPFPENVDIPSAWCISSDIVAPDAAGKTIHFEMEEK
jgi:predicted metal-dependent peptidase